MPSRQTPTAREVEDEIRRLFAREAETLADRKVLLFGSRATGAARPESDFDIGVLGESPLPLADYYRILDELDEIPTLFSIDLVDLNRSSPALRDAAVSEGRLLYEGRKNTR